MAKLIESFLSASQNDQSQITIWFSGNKLTGVVVQFDMECVELRHESGRSIVRLANIDAVSTK